MSFKMPEPQLEDPGAELVLTRMDDNHICIRSGDQSMIVSEFTAAQIVGCLSLFLNIRIHLKDAAGIRLGGRKRTEFDLGQAVTTEKG